MEPVNNKNNPVKPVNNNQSKLDIQHIMKTNQLTIPAWVLYTLIQSTEVSVRRGGVSASEMSTVGMAYDQGSDYLFKLIKFYEEKLNNQPTPLKTIPENDVISDGSGGGGGVNEVREVKQKKHPKDRKKTSKRPKTKK